MLLVARWKYGIGDEVNVYVIVRCLRGMFLWCTRIFLDLRYRSEVERRCCSVDEVWSWSFTKHYAIYVALYIGDLGASKFIGIITDFIYPILREPLTFDWEPLKECVPVSSTIKLPKCTRQESSDVSLVRKMSQSWRLWNWISSLNKFRSCFTRIDNQHDTRASAKYVPSLKEFEELSNDEMTYYTLSKRDFFSIPCTTFLRKGTFPFLEEGQADVGLQNFLPKHQNLFVIEIDVEPQLISSHSIR